MTCASQIAQAVSNLLKVSSSEEVEEIRNLLDLPQQQTSSLVVPSTEAERKQAEQDQYADVVLSPKKSHGGDDSPAEESSCSFFTDLAKYVPLRLEFEERRLLRLLESTIDSSEYTDRVEVSVPNPHQLHRHTATVLRNICSVLSGLVVADSPEKASSVLSSRNFKEHKNLFQSIFEIARRYKLLNPERMRDSYVKMMYLLQDMGRPEVVELLEFDLSMEVNTVYGLLKKADRLALLADPFMERATAEIIPRGKSRSSVQDEIREKEAAIKRLATKYGYQKRFSLNIFAPASTTEGTKTNVSKDQIERCLYSICDLNTFLRFNQLPCERMIELLQKHFSPTDISDPLSSLAITQGSEGARLSHSHSRQYTFVLQSLALWAEVMKDMLRLWHAAETDLLDPLNPYVRTETGQGLQRVQKSPRLLKLMTDLLRRVQLRLGGWVGSSTIHLGDENVPNALMFIDKYLQVPRILGPIVLCIDKIESADHLGVPDLVQRMGGVENVHKMILRDFFRHGFDGAGSSDFFSSGSCIDGRLTSAWNWCSQIESKPFFPLFQLTGFVGFDHSGK